MTSNLEKFIKVKNKNSWKSEYYGNPKPVKDTNLLSQVTLEVLGFTPKAVKDQLLGMGKDLIDPTTGKEYPDDFYEELLDQAVANTEKELDIVIRPRVTSDRQDFNQTEFNSGLFIRTTERPIVQLEDLSLGFNNHTLYDIPDQWIKVNNLYGQVTVQPNAIVTMPYNVFSQMNSLPIFPLMGNTNFSTYNTTQFASQLLGITYIAGMLPKDPNDRGINRPWYVHPDLVAYVAKKATIEVLERWGRTILGAGIAGYNINVDGISTGVDSTQSAENTGSTADIKLLQTDMKDIKDNLQNYYGRNIGVLS